MNDRLPIEEEIAALMDAADEPDPALFQGLIEDDARRTLVGLLRALRREQTAVEDARAWARTVYDEVERANAPRLRTVAFLEEQVARVAEGLIPAGRKSVDVPGIARIQYRDLKDDVRIAEPESFIDALGADERERLVEMRPHLKTNEAKAYARTVIEESGELMPGIERVEARRTTAIQWGVA